MAHVPKPFDTQGVRIMPIQRPDPRDQIQFNTGGPRPPVKLIGGAILAILLFVAFFVLVDWSHVRGNQLGVKETWFDGIVDHAYPPRTYMLFPGYSKTMYRYDMSPKVFVMSDVANLKHEKGREKDAYLVKSADNQTMRFEMSMQWRFDPAMIVTIHREYHCPVGTDAENIIEERLLRPVVQKAANTEGTARKAIDAYSGAGFVELQKAIEAYLTDPKGELRMHGIIVENFVIQQITLDEKYIGEINMRQVAEQKKLRLDKETEAAVAESLRAKAEAQADYEKQIVEAKRKKEQIVLESEGAAAQQVNEAKAAAEKAVIAAEADAKRVTLAANAERDAGQARASAILALGTAEAEATKLRMSAYNAPGVDNFVRMEVAKSVAVAFSGIKGYLPESMHVNLLSGSFMDAVNSMMGKPVAVPEKK